MEEKSCSFFGHRKIKYSEKLHKRVEKTIENLVNKEGVTTFLFGSRSEFDTLCHSIVTDLKLKYPHIKRKAYTCRSESCTLENEREKWEEIYSHFEKRPVTLLGVEEEVEHKTKWTSGKAQYVERNYAMIDDSYFCVFYYDPYYQPPRRKYSKRSIGDYQPKSGTQLALDYAYQRKRGGKDITLINVYEEDDEI